MTNARAFTLVEILIVLGLITTLASTVLVAINPSRQFAQARNSQRISNTNALLNAIGNRMAERRGSFTGPGCEAPLPGTPVRMASAAYDIRPCLVPLYLPELPVDPSTGVPPCQEAGCDGNEETYDTAYTIEQDPVSGRVRVCAPGAAELSLEESGPYCVSR